MNSQYGVQNSNFSIPPIHPDKKKPNYLLIGFASTVAVLLLPAIFILTKKPVSSLTAEAPSLQPTPTTAPTNTLAYYITTSQQYLARAQTLSANKNQTDTQKQEIIAEIQKSLDSINQGLREYPRDDRGYSQRATIYETIAPAINGARQNAIVDLKKATTLNAQNPDYYRRLGNLYKTIGDLTSSASAFYNAYTISPSDNQTLYNLADSLEKSGQVKQAVRYFDKLITLLPESDTNRITLLERKKQLEKLVLAANGETLTSADEIPQKSANTVFGMEELPLRQAAAGSNLIIADSAQAAATENVSLSLNAKSGESQLQAGQTEIIIDNNNVSESSKIVVVPAGETEGKTIFVKSKKAAQGNCIINPSSKVGSDSLEVESQDCLPAEQGWFKVGLDSPLQTELKFNWWIIE